MRTAIGLAVLAGVLAACGVAPQPSGTWSASAVIEVIPPSAMPEGSRVTAGDDAYFATAVEKIRLPQTVLRAVRDGHLASLPAFEGRSEDDITREIAAGLHVRQRAKSWLVEIVVSGERREVLVGEANAMAAAFLANETAAAQSDVTARRAAAQERLDCEDAQLRLLGIDRSTALQGVNVSHTTIDAEIEALGKRRTTFVDAQDQLTLRLIAVDSKAKAGSPPVDDRKELVLQQRALDDRIRELDRDLTRAAAAKARVDQINFEIARHAETKTAALRDLESLRERPGEPTASVRIVAFAAEPTQPR